jgi:hypothetical protein
MIAEDLQPTLEAVARRLSTEPSLTNEVASQISEFYSALSGHLDALFDHSRWLSSGPYLSVEERTAEIRALLVSLERAGLSGDDLSALRDSEAQTFRLAEGYLKQANEKALIGPLREEVERWQAELDQQADRWTQIETARFGAVEVSRATVAQASTGAATSA